MNKLAKLTIFGGILCPVVVAGAIASIAQAQHTPGLLAAPNVSKSQSFLLLAFLHQVVERKYRTVEGIYSREQVTGNREWA